MRAARPLFLHHSALSPEEYTPFTLWLDELLPPPALPTASSSSPSTRTTPTSISDQDALEALIRVDDIGRFLLEKLQVEEQVWEDVLSIFHPNHRSLQPRNSISQSHLRALPPLKGGEVFVVFRLVGHSRLGKPVHIEGRKLAFWQAAPPLPSTEPSSASSASKPYPPPRSTTKPPPPPQHLARKNSSSAPSSVIGHRSTPSLSKELPPQVSPQPPPPLNPNPFRRSSQPSSASPAKPLPTNAKGGPSSSDSDGLKKVTEDALAVDSSPSSSSSEDEGAEEVGRNHRRWQTPMSGREDSDSKHSGEGIRAGKPSSSTKSGVQRSETTESFLTVSSSAFSPLVAAKLGLSPHSSSTIVSGGSPSSAHPPRPSTGSPLMINVDGSPSSNPFRTRLDSASGQSIPSDQSPISPPLPPRRRPSSVIGKSPSNPSSSTAPPLPPRDNATLASSSAQASAGDSSSFTTNSPSKPKPPPTKPPKPTTFTHSNSFHTTPLIQQSLLAAKGARKQEEMSAGRERKFEVIGSSSVLYSGARSGRSESIAGGSSGTDGVGISPVPTGSGAGVGGGGGGGKFATVNASIGLVGGTRSHRSHSLVTSPFRSPPIIASARPEREYPFPQPLAQAPPPPPSTVILQPSPTYAKPPPPPPQRRNSLYTHPSKPPPPPPTTSSASVLLNRHASLSSAHSRSSSQHHPHSRSNTNSTQDPLKDGLRAMEQGVGWLKGAAVTSAGRVASASSGKGRGGKVERERLVASDEEDEGEDSGEEERRVRRRELEREEGRGGPGEESWRRLD